ncbi:hypothetical protein C2S51_029771 [Perilla frutescens var. frutescens]|nr:hypothetical protein C2S51_029771 [Perilla frutescens var. frutescens]
MPPRALSPAELIVDDVEDFADDILEEIESRRYSRRVLNDASDVIHIHLLLALQMMIFVKLDIKPSLLLLELQDQRDERLLNRVAWTWERILDEVKGLELEDEVVMMRKNYYCSTYFSCSSKMLIDSKI